MKKTESLKKTYQFSHVYNNGISRANKYLVMYFQRNNRDYNRLGISVSKKVGNSVVRHHMCRLIREAYRLHENMFDSGLDIVVVVRRGADEATYHQIEDSLIHLAKLHHIYIEETSVDEDDEKNTDTDDQIL